MSELKRLIAQTLLFGFEGATINEVINQLNPLIDLNIAGFILFSNHFKQRQLRKNITDTVQTQKLISDLQSINHEKNVLPLLMAVDYEGGRVDRLHHLQGAPKTITGQQSALISNHVFYHQIQAMADFCSKLGFNVNFAPVVDLNLSEGHGVINALERSYGSDPDKVCEMAWQFMQPFLQLGIACCLKHYPGHGSTAEDTHHEVVDVTNSYFLKELLPFERIIHKQHPLVMTMTAHIINRQLDDTGLPATLSYKMLQEQLRDRWHYRGVIVSDDLQMLALASKYSLPERLAMAINAGCDLLIIGNQLDYVEPLKVIDTMESLVNNGTISLSRLKQAAERVSKLKQNIFITNKKEAV